MRRHSRSRRAKTAVSFGFIRRRLLPFPSLALTVAVGIDLVFENDSDAVQARKVLGCGLIVNRSAPACSRRSPLFPAARPIQVAFITLLRRQNAMPFAIQESVGSYKRPVGSGIVRTMPKDLSGRARLWETSADELRFQFPAQPRIRVRARYAEEYFSYWQGRHRQDHVPTPNQGRKPQTDGRHRADGCRRYQRRGHDAAFVFSIASGAAPPRHVEGGPQPAPFFPRQNSIAPHTRPDRHR